MPGTMAAHSRGPWGWPCYPFTFHYQFACFLNRQWWILQMDHRVAIWADGAKVSYWVNSVAGANLGNWNNVMNMNELGSDFTVALLK